ncbi:MAG: gliding motility-associated C-terminal domain-containing protein [Prevotella sp.]|nr:gliding motility-associated C-terminal domain-containing protein [Prevotella sp.]MCI6509942.1 gliding motility-associated C-terminal domain-containing protein [Prevotella sp.]MCI7269194.1 gliding motility-associated C-terminal domain-containing protein [Prevotella sp.]MDY4843096.1 gliding motility-associated C-terminal domain-containing protein [Prevotella sp.]MDY4990668.1 gliding motility-associated C-terminal domain-containing protein [Prevotella sp.]
MNIRGLLLVIACLFLAFANVEAQENMPAISPTATITTATGETQEVTEYSGSAPLQVHFAPNVENPEGYEAYYEWRFYKEGTSIEEPYLVRHEEETDFTFNEAGGHCIALIAYFMNGNDTIVKYDTDYWMDATPIRISISTSKLDFPNAFSPNGDGMNDIYRAKTDYQSIVEFKAVIYNRWGQKLYEWNNPAGGWDGTYKGNPVKQGVYYVQVTAKGADGRRFNIKKDVNLLRTFDNTVE